MLTPRDVAWWGSAALAAAAASALPALGHVGMALLGGAVAHIRHCEGLVERRSFRREALAFFGREFLAGVAGLVCWLLALEYDVEARPLVFVASALAGMFAAEFFDLLWRRARKVLRAQP